jgi:hypothetical protein
VADETPVYRVPIAPGWHRIQILHADHTYSAAQRVMVRSGQARTLGFDR